jgi:hypothetical protein
METRGCGLDVTDFELSPVDIMDTVMIRFWIDINVFKPPPEKWLACRVSISGESRDPFGLLLTNSEPQFPIQQISVAETVEVYLTTLFALVLQLAVRGILAALHIITSGHGS